jgi:hypothetical protein
LVTLFDGNTNATIASTTTDAFGGYSFTNLTPGNYIIGVTKPAAYTLTSQNAGTDTKDSDINTTTGKTAVYTLVAEQNNPTIDAGMYITTPNGTLLLGDKVWVDNNKNGVQDIGEPGVAGVTVTLYQNGPDGLPGTSDDVKISNTSTDVNGKYLFTDLGASTGPSTNYNVLFTNIPAEYTITGTDKGGDDGKDSDPTVSTSRTESIDLFADNLTIDAGVIQGIPAGKGSIGDKVWVDLGTPNGLQDAGEPGVSGVIVNLYKDEDGNGLIDGTDVIPVATTTTDGLGNYLFSGLDAGNYQVGYTNIPAGYNLTNPNSGGDDLRDSDGNTLGIGVNGNPATPGTAFTALMPLAQGEDNLTVDLGLITPANTNTLGDYVWYDFNNNGVQDGTETPTKGVMVTLYDLNGLPIASTVTDENGKYLFTGLADGKYSVGFSNLPAGYSFTTASPSNDLAGSDANAVTGKTTTVILGASNRNDMSLDAGLVNTTRAALGNYVWFDTDADGIQDATENGVSGVTVSLYRPGFGLDGIAGNADDAQPVATSITDGSGKYFFGNLLPGNYQIGVSTTPSGVNITKQVTPGDNQNDTNSDLNPTTGLTPMFNLVAGETDLTIDAGLTPKPTATVGDYVWMDSNINGIQDPTEAGVAGILVKLYDNANNLIGAAVTDGSGKYLITNVPAGTGYYVTFSKPTDAAISFTNTGAPSGTDNSKADPTGKTNAFSVAPGENVTNIDAGLKQASVLAVKYLSFTADKVNTTSVLNFTIAQAANGSTFTIERSSNGLNFSAIGTLNGTNATSYNFTDVTPIVNAKNYYRIKEFDAQGKVTYSDLRMVKFTKDGKVEVYPIPATTNLNITFTDLTNKPVVITLYNNVGQIVLNKRVNNASSTEIVNVSNLASGTYQLRITNNNEIIEDRKIVIMK